MTAESQHSSTEVSSSGLDAEKSLQTPPEAETPLEAGNEAKPPAMDFPEGGARAWACALGAFGVTFSTFGYVNAFGVYQEYYQTHQLSGYSPSSISWIGSIQTFFLFAGSIVTGPLFDRVGAKTIWPSAMLFVFSVMMTSISKEFYQFMLAQGVLGGLSIGFAIAPAMSAPSQYFNKKRGASMGLTIAGSSLGGVIFPIAMAKMFANPKLGFGWTVRICGFIMVALLVPSCFAIRARLPPRKNKFFLPAAFKEPSYSLLVIGGPFIVLGMFIPIFYLPTYAVQNGMSRELASYIVSILNAASFFGRIIPGILADKLGRYNMLLFAGGSTGILIFCWQRIHSNAGIIVFSGLFGFCSGAIVSGLAVCIVNCAKSPKDIGTYMGMGYSVASIGALIGPPINGALVNHYGGFTQVSIFGGCITLFATAVITASKWCATGVFARS